MPKENILQIVLFVTAVSYLIFGSLFSMLLVVLSVLALRKMMLKRLGGMTGDTLGAVVEITEAAALLGLVF